ncbi:hypothetical protein [Paenibacillus chitinolyticus]|uniref:hypothetical protein n=1 Tax=Paenibacillus chitinolyticus TaxID=79263 RepID=UPI001C44190B|nr:hypothetical protein [Paenibacillus chitinolyticus]MBV6717235.1 hypothetical protein [Paenibacillus chitinolyticus]
MIDQYRYEFLEKENERLKNLVLEQLSEIVTLKNEVRNLKQEIANRQVGEQEKRLVLLAKSIIQKLDPRGEVSER